MAQGQFWEGITAFFGGSKAAIAEQQIEATAALAAQQLAAQVEIEKAKNDPEAIAERNKLYVQITVALLLAGIIITFIIIKLK